MSIYDVADDYVDSIAEADPVLATFAGIKGHDREMTDYSPEGFERRAELQRRTLRWLGNQEAKSSVEQVQIDAMTERLSLEVELYDAGVTTSNLNVIDSPMQDIRMVFDLMPTDTDDDWQTIAYRLGQTLKGFNGYRRTLTEALYRGRPAARRQIEACIAQCRSWLTPENDVFGKLVAPALPRYAEPAAGLADVAKQGVAEFAEFLETTLLPEAREKDAVGRESYALHSRYFLGAAVDLDETYAWGWDELHRIETEMAKVAGEIVPGGSVDDAVAALDADPNRTIGSKEEFRDWMQIEADRAIYKLNGTHFDIPEPIQRIECRIAPTADGGIYYTGPSEDFSRPGRMWWSVPEEQATFATWRELTTVFHEGVPGHHLQIGQAAYRKSQLNRWQRLLSFVSGHGEGWALYAERLMDELGFFDDPGNKLGFLDSQGFRAARVIVDIGMHLELPIPPNPYNWRVGETWTPELGMEFLLAHSRVEEPILRFELNRYLGWPGQAPSYKVGERIWLQAREDAKARKGADFDLKSFHRAALDLGGLGLDPLRAALPLVY